MVMHDRARDIIGAATIGAGPWLPVRLSGFLAVPPRLPPLRLTTALPTAMATRHLPMDTATPHLPMATVRVAATRTTAANCYCHPQYGQGKGRLESRPFVAPPCTGSLNA